MLLAQFFDSQKPGPTPFREVASIAPEWPLIRKEMPQKGPAKSMNVACIQRNPFN